MALVGRYYCLAFTGMAMQGRSHDITKQKATLLNLVGMQDKAKKLQFEWAHVSYVPVVDAARREQTLF